MHKFHNNCEAFRVLSVDASFTGEMPQNCEIYV